MATAELNGAAITDFDSFHAACKAAFGFPDGYANTMDAWVDCLSYLRDDDGMSVVLGQPLDRRQLENVVDRRQLAEWVVGHGSLRRSLRSLLERPRLSSWFRTLRRFSV